MASGGSKRGNKGAERPARRAPHNLDAERALLGAALLRSEALEILATRTQPGDFYRPNHGHIAAALTTAFEQGWNADPVTIAAELERQGLLEQIGGSGELLSLEIGVPTTSTAPRYAEIVHEHATRRRLIGWVSEVANSAYGDSDDVHDVIERAQKALTDVAANNGARTYSSLNVPDLGPFLDGTHELEQAVLLTRSDGKNLFYPGKMHVLQAEPSSGKSWITLKCSVDVLAAGGAVCYLDYEDAPAGITGRLLALRAAPDDIRERFLYLKPEGPFGLAEKVHLRAMLDKLNPDLIVLDGVAEALARDGYDEDRNADVVAWTEKYPRWLANTGATVVMIDHVTKDPEKRGRHARGAGHKLAAVDGASYEILVSQPFSRHKAGRILLRIAKDRPGGVGAIGEIAAAVSIEPHADGTLVDIHLEPPQLIPAEPWKPTHLMQRVSEQLEQNGLMTAATVKAVIQSKKNLVEAAIARLLMEGYITEVKHGRTTHLRSVKPYRDRSDADHNEPAEPPEPRLTDEQLFDDNPGVPADELAARRRKKETKEPPADVD